MKSVGIVVRMETKDREAIRRAAGRHRVSMSAFLLRAGLAACNGRGRSTDTGLSPEAEDALTALTGAGHTPKEAKQMVRRVLIRKPQASADELVALAYRKDSRQ